MEKTKWTLFWDMHSGGSTKEPPYEKIYIEAPITEANVIFYHRFGRVSEEVDCPCCGDNYSVSESDSLEQATDYHRDCEYSDTFLTIEEYIKQKDVLIIRSTDIKDKERLGCWDVIRVNGCYYDDYDEDYD